MAWYEVYRNDEPFIKFYNEKPHLYKRHEKDFNKRYNDEYLELANTYRPSDLEEWFKSLGKLFEYDKDLYAKVDRKDNLIIISYYSLNYVTYYCHSKDDYYKYIGLFMRFIYNVDTTAMYHYRMKTFKNIAYVLNTCDHKNHMGGWTDFDKFYIQQQRKLDENSIQVLKSLDQFKYLPIEKFKRINVYNLFQVNEDTIYQYELLLKNGLYNLASDLLIDRAFITPDNFKHFKKAIMSGIRYKELRPMIWIFEEEKKEKQRKLEKQEMKKAYAEMPKLEFDLGDYVLIHPKTFKDLEREGRELNHCVASYLDRIVNKETDVMFLRKKVELDKPFFTIELRGNSVIQVRTLKNKSDPNITELIKNWNSQRLHA